MNHNDNTTLAADVSAYRSSLRFYHQNCWRSLTGYPFFGEAYVKIDYDACTSLSCPIVFNRTLSNRTDPATGDLLPKKFAPFHMDHNPSKRIYFKFNLRAYLDSSNRHSQTFQYDGFLKCNNLV